MVDICNNSRDISYNHHLQSANYLRHKKKTSMKDANESTINQPLHKRFSKNIPKLGPTLKSEPDENIRLHQKSSSVI